MSTAQPESEPYYVVRKSRIHGEGVYASRLIPQGARIIEYVGEKLTKSQSEKRGSALLEKAKQTGEGAVYLFILNKKYDLDGNVPWNTARLVNHSCEPNCEAEVVRGRIWYVALQDIPEGTELTLNYGFDVENWEDHPCRCGSARCVGYIVAEEQWPKLKREMKKKDNPPTQVKSSADKGRASKKGSAK